MSEPNWLSKGLVLAFHNELLNRFGGSTGIRDEGLLESAMSKPQQLYHYESPSLFEMAASYGFGIVKNHPFVDGNKRTGFIAAALFLEKNGYRFTAPEAEAVIQTLALAAGELDQAGFAEWLQQNSSAC
jgi:death-on-curing protein